ncbi:MAG: drug/metabolite exporter YedA [Myxococcaceae bacterium]
MRALGRPVLISLFLVYVVWGSTYLVMRFAVAGLPPLQMAGVRFLIAGGLLFGYLKLCGTPWPTAKEWLASLPVGVLLFVFGNGCVAIAEQKISSGVAAVVCGTTPLVAAALGPLFKERATPREWLSMALGMVGVVILSLGGELRAEPASAAILISAPIAWGVASLLSRKLPLPKGPVSAATEMLTGGAMLLTLGLARGESWPAHPDPKAVGSLIYLIVFGSLVGFTAFNHLLRVTRPAISLSYSYVNPVVAVFLAALFDTQEITPRVILSSLLIVGSTAITILGKPATPPAAAAASVPAAPRSSPASPALE